MDEKIMPTQAGEAQIVSNMRGDRAFDSATGKIASSKHEPTFAQRVLTFVVAAGLMGALSASSSAATGKPAAAGGHYHHRSIWAQKWAAAHPAQEAAYQRSLVGKYAWHPARRWAPRGRAYYAAAKPAGPHTAWSTNRHWRRSRHWRRWSMAPAVIQIPSTVAEASSHSGYNAGGVNLAQPSTVVTAQPAPKTVTVPAAPPLPAPVQVAKADERVAQNDASVDASGPNVSLDFVAADINDVLKSLAMQTHTNIVSGADVKGDITVTLNNVTLDEALDMITKLSGFGYAKVGRTYVVGTPSSIQSLTQAGTAATPPVTAVITLTYSNFAQMTTTINDRYPNVKVTPGTANGNVGSGGVLIVTGTDDDVAGVKALVQESEEALASGVASSKTVYYRIRYSAPMDLMSVMSRLVPGVLVTPAPTSNFNLSAPSTADAGSSTTTTNYGASSSGGSGQSTATSSNGSSVSSTTTSSVSVKPNVTALLLTGNDQDIKRALDILAEIDIRPAQIAYDAKITEVSLDKTRNIGLNWSFSGASTRIGELPDQTATPPSTLSTGTSAGNIIKFGVISRTPISDLADVSLDAVFNDADTKILADPNISAVDGQQAAVFIGDTVNYVSSIAQTTTGPSVTTASVNVGIKLFVAGKVSDDGYVTVNIHPEVSTISSWLDVPGGGQLPQIASREATTTVRVKDGDYIAIGGLINEQDVTQINKVPGLGDLPFFGSLFRDNQKSKTRDEIVIFVKVSIQKDNA